MRLLEEFQETVFGIYSELSLKRDELSPNIFGDSSADEQPCLRAPLVPTRVRRIVPLHLSVTNACVQVHGTPPRTM